MKKPRLFLRHYGTKDYGSFFGYSNLYRDIKSIVEHDDDSDICLSVVDPMRFTRVASKRVNVLLSMWESIDFPRQSVANLRQADVLIVPTTYCRDVFRPIVDCPIHVVPLAVDGDVFSYKERSAPDGVFRWLWVNAPDVRKGYHALGFVFENYFRDNLKVEFYLKTTGGGKERLVRPAKNLVFDSRKLPRDELVSLYHEAHGYMYPTMGEGFGYTLAEAMATGLPSVATNMTGHTDFFNSKTGYPVDTARCRVPRNLGESLAEDGLYEIGQVSHKGMYREMSRVMKRYDHAVAHARRGAEFIRKFFNFEAMSEGIAKVVAQYRR